ncbi:hypothetical protein PILCRDRAFT_728873 [Piloderma croceum F 1598]|uniref:C2 domain-containing protein n=1 Tax=Piloderma croceum (strain F 1598) TaxID=765440 RepID=A0A0C3F068_PILCF|nr:hypothetical protein PILCRDRAFT_728873 [Piloderma croceum F 1598]
MADELPPKAYKLHIGSIDRIVWPKKLFQKKPPNLYVEVQVGESVQHTRVVERSTTPAWNEEFSVFGYEISNLSLSVMHHTSLSLMSDTCLGGVEICLSRLLDIYAVLELRSKKGRADSTINGLITVRLSTSDPTLAGAIAMSTVRQDIERSDILAVTAAGDSRPAQVFGAAVTFVSQPGDIVTLLESVISKLDLFVRIVDQAATVHPYANFAWTVTSSLYKAIRGQIYRDQNLVDLLTIMKDVSL